MILNYHRRKPFLLCILVVLMITSLISACSSFEQTDQSLATSTLDVQYTPQPTLTIQPPTPAPPTATPSPSPTIEAATDDQKADAGMFVLAMNDGKFDQLYAYHPLNLPLTRLTKGDFDHADPAVNPNGTRIAFCAKPDGKWEVFTLDLLTGLQVQISRAEGYACAPTWSSDGLWLAYETLSNGKLVILLQSTIDTSKPPINLTDDFSNSFDPAWSPGGREIAFVTDRNGKLEIWKADLNAVENRLSPLLSSIEANFSSPAWSMDGRSLAWNKITDQTVVEKQDYAEDEAETLFAGSGIKPTWVSNDLGIAALLRTPNGYDLVTYHHDPTRLLFPPLYLPGNVTSVTWQSEPFVANVTAFLESINDESTVETDNDEAAIPQPTNGLASRVHLDNLKAPEAYLADSVATNYIIMREALDAELGWDFLGILQNAFVSLPADNQVNIQGKWLYTGRAISVNVDPFTAGWMQVSREDYTGRTFWRVWLKCMAQDGTCGAPLKEPVWDFYTRSNGDLAGYENGGDTGAMPEGYWFDFTAFALNYGWERIPADSNWRNYFPATNISIFALKDGLTWRQAMLLLYTSEELAGILQ
jgi:TolB protein